MLKIRNYFVILIFEILLKQFVCFVIKTLNLHSLFRCPEEILLKDMEKIGEVVESNLKDTTPKDNSNTNHYKTNTSQNFTKLVIIEF